MLVEKMGFNVSVTGILKTKIFKGHTQTMGFLGVLFNYQFVISESVKVKKSNHKSILSSTLTLAFFLQSKDNSGKQSGSEDNSAFDKCAPLKFLKATNKQLQKHLKFKLCFMTFIIATNKNLCHFPIG